MAEFQIIDNFLSKLEHSIISETLQSSNFPWFYHPFVAINNDLDRGDFYFEHTFYKDYQPNSNFFPMLEPIIKKIDVKAMIMCKANLYTNIGTLLKNGLHTDQKYPHRGAIYYVNTNNGYTGFEDGSKVESVANSLMLFDSHTPHHSTHCTDQKVRLNINFNFF